MAVTTALRRKIHLSHNDVDQNLSSLSDSISELRQESLFFDVTLASDDGASVIRAHKVILAASSPVLKELLKGVSAPSGGGNNSLLYLRGVSAYHLQAIADFIYHGQVDIYEEELNGLVEAATDLQIVGLDRIQVRSDNETSTNNSSDIVEMMKAEPEEPGQLLTDEDHTDDEDDSDGTDTDTNTSTSDTDETKNDQNEESNSIDLPERQRGTLTTATNEGKNKQTEGGNSIYLPLPEGQIKDNLYECKTCRKAIKKPGNRFFNLAKHYRMQHMSVPKEKCSICGLTLKNKNTLASHKSKLHSASTYCRKKTWAQMSKMRKGILEKEQS